MAVCKPRRFGTAFSTVVLAALLGVGLCACGSSSKSASPPATAPTAGASPATVTTSASSKFGTILVSSSGMTLYMLTSDSSQASTCTGSCPSIWPPLLTNGAPRASGGADATLLGTITRPGGAVQVTYDGHPLYTFSGDTAPGQVNGEAIHSFGGTWYVLGPSGHPLTGSSSSTTTSTTGGGGYQY